MPHDAVIVGGGHNALVAAAYLAKAGHDVLLLERAPRVGGAAVSERPFMGVDARLSRYSYLVSLLPQRIVDDLGLRLDLARRRYSSYTPDPATGGATGFLDDTQADPERIRLLLERVGAGADAEHFRLFSEYCRVLTERVWPTMMQPLLTKSEMRDLVLAGGDARAATVWTAMVETPIGRVIANHHDSDLVRGVLLTDALIGTFAGADDADLTQNICMLYHLVGGGSGDWDVPIGGMGRVTDELARVAVDAGATLVTGAEAVRIDPDAGVVDYVHDGAPASADGRLVLAGVAPTVLARLTGSTPPPAPEGAQVKVNLVVRRLPRLKDIEADPRHAFAGTFHVNETWTQLETARAQALEGRIPDPLPLEIYCHSLTDPSILGADLVASGAHTLTVFGLHVPHRLSVGVDPDEYRTLLRASVLASIDSVLAEPIESLLLTDANGEPCIEVRTTVDLERELGMPGGNIFHGPLEWPWADDDAPLSSPAERWGVATAHERVLMCGSGSRRGGAVSGLGGHNAAMAALELLGD